MVRYSNISHNVFATRRLIREYGRQQIIGSHALNRWWSFAPTGESQYGQGPRGIPSPSRREHWGGQKSLSQNVFHAAGVEEFEDGIEGEAVLLAERNHDPVLGGCRLKFEIECAA
jgi:hypothetical protein